MFERYSPSALEVVVLAQHEAHRLGHVYLGTEHLLLGMLGSQEGIAAQCLLEAGVTLDDARRAVKELVGSCVVADLLSEADAVALEAIGIDLDAVRARVEDSFGPSALGPQPPRPRRFPFGRRRCRDRLPGQLVVLPRAKKVLELALRESRGLGHDVVGPEHILLGLIREGEGVGLAVLVRAQVSPDELRARVLGKLGQAA